MMRCVCGCLESEHHPVVMSVPMTAGRPSPYKVIGQPLIFLVDPNAIYECEQCSRCGCTVFEADLASTTTE
jgi:hypothetical protein